MKVLVLRSNNKDNRSYGNFQYPSEGYVEALDWKDEASCGNGLHGFLWGAGDGRLANWDEAAKWMVLEVETEEGFVDLGDKVKFRRGRVVLVADRKTATDYVLANRPTSEAKPVIGSIVAAGDYGTATAGDGGTATAGDYGTATAGEGGIIQIKYWDGKRYRLAVGYIGEDNLEANVSYTLDSKGKFVKA